MTTRRAIMATALAALATPRLAHAQRAKPLVFVPQADLGVLDPVTAAANIGRTHGMMVFDTLYGMDAAFQPQPQMVEGATVERDGRLWRMVLRPGLRFHDGEPVLASDVVASLRRWGRGDNFGQLLFASVDALEVVDDRTFLFRLKQPFPQLPNALAKVTTPMPFIAPARLIGEERSVPMKEIIGSGPFRFMAGDMVPGAQYAYERFDGYLPREGGGTGFSAGPKRAKVGRVEWRVIPDAATAASALQAGEVDWWDYALPDMAPALARAGGITVEPADRMGLNGYLRMNHLQPPFDNPAIRRALLPAVDQVEYMTAVMGDAVSLTRTPAGIFTPGTPMANDEGLSVLSGPRSIEAAKQALTAAGYRGEKVVLMNPTDFASISTMAEVTGDLLRRLGMNVEMQANDWGTMLQRRNNRGAPAQGGWNIIAMANSGPDMLSPASHLQLRANGVDGPQGWPSSPRMEALRLEWLAASSIEAQRAIARQMQAQNWQDVVLIPLGQYLPQTAYRSRVQRGNRDMTVFYDLDA